MKKNEDWWREKGFKARDNKNHEEAIRCFTKMIEINPINGFNYPMRADVYEKKGDYNNAITDLTKAIKLNYDLVHTLHNRANVYRKNGEYDKAIADCTQLIRTKPNHYKRYQYLSRSMAYADKHDYSNALKDAIKTEELGLRIDSESLETLRRSFYEEINPKIVGKEGKIAQKQGRLWFEREHKVSLLPKSSENAREIINAIKKKDLGKVKALIAAGVELNAEAYEGSDTPLVLAIYVGYSPIVKILIDAGADVNLFSYGRSLLEWAVVIKGNYNIARLLIAAGANANDLKDTSAIIRIAAWKGHTKIVKILRDVGATYDEHIKKLENIGRFCNAVEDGNIGRVNKLIQAGADVNMRDWSDDTPLMIAADKGHIAIVSSLIAAGADVNAQQEHYGVIDCASDKGNAQVKKRMRKIRKMLKEAGAKDI